MKTTNVNHDFAIITYRPAPKGTGEPDTTLTRHLVTAARTADAMDRPYLLPLPDGVRLAAYPAINGPSDGDGILALAAYTQRAEWRWRLRNGYAVLSALDEAPEMVEDNTSVAAVAIVEYLQSHVADWDEHAAYRAAFAAVSAERSRLVRRGEIEYQPDWAVCNPDLAARLYRERDAAPLPAELVRFVRRAIDAANLTDGQAAVLSAIMQGQQPADTMGQLSITRGTYYDRRKAALSRVAAAMLDELDTPGMVVNQFARAGWSISVDEMRAALTAAKERHAAAIRAKKGKAGAVKCAAAR